MFSMPAFESLKLINSQLLDAMLLLAGGQHVDAGE